MMKRKVFSLCIALLVVVAALVPAGGFFGTAYADDPDPMYTVALRYFDNIQITYTGHYPSGDVWGQTGDVPIGGCVIPDQEIVSGQIYCADPFVAFHSNANAVSVWDNGSTLDTVQNYTVAAPWAMSSAMQTYYDEVAWIVLNGYRGDFLSDDYISDESVARLNKAYPKIGAIDKTIALMATKIAVWRIVMADSIVILKTSLDSKPAQRKTMDDLADALVSDARAKKLTALKATSLSLEIVGKEGAELTGTGPYYYGPLRVNAKLENLPSGSNGPFELSQIYLTAAGINADDIKFVDSAHLPLDTGIVYGTSSIEQCLDGQVFGAGNGLESDDFYLEIPTLRADEKNLKITAMAKAAKIPLLEGTPITFVYCTPGGNGVQEWEEVQAFVGGAGDGMEIDLYAMDVLNTDVTVTGDIYLVKEVENGGLGDEFAFRLYTSASNDFSTAAQVLLNDGFVLPAKGRVNTENNTIETEEGWVEITGLPADKFYWIEEVGQPGGYTTEYKIDIADTLGIPLKLTLPGTRTSAFKMDIDVDGLAMVTFINKKEVPKTQLYVTKIAYDLDSEGNAVRYAEDPFSFKIEYADKNADFPGSPLDLRSVFESSTDVSNTDPSLAAGTFSIKSNDMASIELDPEYKYRVAEINPGAGYSPAYSIVHMHYKGDLDWEATVESNIAEGWALEGGYYTTSEFEVVPGDFYMMVISNTDYPESSLELSKKVDGNASASSKNQPFSFQVLYTNSALDLDSYPLPLSYDFIEGIPEGRISVDWNNNPTVVWLKDGETAVIKNLPPGEYMICEVPETGYTATYAIDSGKEKPVNAGGRTEAFHLSGDTAKVVFRNAAAATRTVIHKPETPVAAEPSDKPSDTPSAPVGPNAEITADTGTVIGTAGDYPGIDTTDYANLGDDGAPQGAMYGDDSIPKTGAADGLAIYFLLMIIAAWAIARGGKIGKRNQ
ncbi:MAG: Cys-Gln thioester bond-forming surface protein [Clostridiales bacterium]|nr:Cys-Gln thioester bond-forming surface protein [Clostridiales bacterium]